MKIIACCTYFDGLLSDVGQKGFSIVPAYVGERRCFKLQARPFEKIAEERLSSVDPQTGSNRWPCVDEIVGKVVPFVTRMDAVIHFCPGCGRRLQDIINKNHENFDKKAHDLAEYWQ